MAKAKPAPRKSTKGRPKKRGGWWMAPAVGLVSILFVFVLIGWFWAPIVRLLS